MSPARTLNAFLHPWLCMLLGLLKVITFQKADFLALSLAAIDYRKALHSQNGARQDLETNRPVFVRFQERLFFSSNISFLLQADWEALSAAGRAVTKRAVRMQPKEMISDRSRISIISADVTCKQHL